MNLFFLLQNSFRPNAQNVIKVLHFKVELKADLTSRIEIGNEVFPAFLRD